MARFHENLRGGTEPGWLRRAARGFVIAAASVLWAIAPARADELDVVVSIKPIHSLVASLMAGVGEPALLVESGGSPHGYTLRPSQAAALSDADLVVWIGEGLESYLSAPLQSLVPEGKTLELATLPEIVLLPLRDSGVWEAHDDAHDADHDHAGYDPHLWLDPHNAIVIARGVAERLAALDSAHAGIYETNLAALTEAIEVLDSKSAVALAPVRDAPFIVFHDAFQYFEQHYGLAGIGAILLDPEQGASAARLSSIRERLSEADVVCAFAEPQVDTGLLETAVEGIPVRIATLDPEGIALEPGPALYANLVDGLVRTMAVCLSPQG